MKDIQKKYATAKGFAILSRVNLNHNMIRGNFTLIELLVVISIIGILISMVIPSLAKARKSAQAKVCLSNQHQVSLAVISYSQDNDDYGPMDNINDYDVHWYDLLMPGYLPEGEKDHWASEVQKCPSGMTHEASGNSTIAINNRMTGKNQSGSFELMRSLRLATPTETCMLMDSHDLWRSTGYHIMQLDRLIEGSEEQNAARHLEKANVTMLDGSGKAWHYRVLLSKNSYTDTFWDPEQ